jgi:hypothetical protein
VYINTLQREWPSTCCLVILADVLWHETGWKNDTRIWLRIRNTCVDIEGQNVEDTIRERSH